MSSKIIFILSLFAVSSCGVKSPPVKFKDKAIDSYIGTYTGQSNSATESQEKSNSQTDQQTSTSTNK